MSLDFSFATLSSALQHLLGYITDSLVGTLRVEQLCLLARNVRPFQQFSMDDLVPTEETATKQLLGER